MDDKLRAELLMLLKGHTPNTAADFVQWGRVSRAAFDRFMLNWHWATFHFGGWGPQDVLRRARGPQAVVDRIERCKRRLAEFTGEAL